ncbi:hypothetical protein Cgig2_019381 [Carnegiea gigantea]|uniref:Uncharacterized protein n=1 Tax=Carnegiea gigantea TaxID=171969 RepID=A0A9Q1KBW0_9CARY|nr:hypothetical protein Cgig2_019381 [Carnegiea gigantea]
MGLDEPIEKLKANLVAINVIVKVANSLKASCKGKQERQDLAREVTTLKQERDALKDESEKRRASQKHTSDFKDLEKMLEKDNKGVSDLPNKSASGGSESTLEIEESTLKNQSDDDEEQKAVEAIVRQHKALFQAKTEQEQRALQAEEALPCSNAIITELETHISQQENEQKKHSEESSDTLAAIKELKAQTQNLEEELEK